MKKIILFLFALTSVTGISNAQTTALDFNRKDCNGTMRHLFADLDAGNAIILEFFMAGGCQPCINAGNRLEEMKINLLTKYPGKIKGYSFGYTNIYSTTVCASWVSDNGFTTFPMDSGAYQLAYYGGFGMPTIVVLGGGTAHSVLGNPYLSFTASDTATMASDIRTFLNVTGMYEKTNPLSEISLYPNPANDNLNLEVSLKETTFLKIEIINTLGELTERIVNENFVPGLMSKNISTNQLAEGIYFLKISTENDTATYRKFSVVR